MVEPSIMVLPSSLHHVLPFFILISLNNENRTIACLWGPVRLLNLFSFVRVNFLHRERLFQLNKLKIKIFGLWIHLERTRRLVNESLFAKNSKGRNRARWFGSAYCIEHVLTNLLCMGGERGAFWAWRSTSCRFYSTFYSTSSQFDWAFDRKNNIIYTPISNSNLWQY